MLLPFPFQRHHRDVDPATLPDFFKNPLLAWEFWG